MMCSGPILPEIVHGSQPLSQEEFNALNERDQIDTRENLVDSSGNPYVLVKFKNGQTAVMDPEPPGITEKFTLRNSMYGFTGLVLFVALILYIKTRVGGEYEDE